MEAVIRNPGPVLAVAAGDEPLYDNDAGSPDERRFPWDTGVLRIPRGRGIPPKVRGLEVPKVVKPCDLLLRVSKEICLDCKQQSRPLKVGRQVLEVYLQGLGGKVEVYLLEVRGFGGRGGDFVKELDKGLDGRELTRWKQWKALIIMESPLFRNLDSKFNRKAWFEKIHKLSEPDLVKSLAAEPSSLTFSNAKKRNLLLKFSSMVTGRQLFTQENHDALSSAAQQRVHDTGSTNPGSVFQNVLREQWDALSGAEQSAWNERAEAESGDVTKNQEEFLMYIRSALRHLCEGKILGDAEMVLIYAFHESGTGDLIAGTVHGHSPHNQLNFGGNEELQLNYGKSWSDFAEDVIPHGHPEFPSIDLDIVPMAEIRMLLCDYVDQCWVATSGIESPTPFRFLVPEERSATPPPTPALAPALSPVPAPIPTPPPVATPISTPVSTPLAALVGREESPAPARLPRQTGKDNNKRPRESDGASEDVGNGPKKNGTDSNLPASQSAEMRRSAPKKGGVAPLNPGRKSTRSKRPPIPGMAAKKQRVTKKKPKHVGWAYVDSDGNEVVDSE
ncbi:hypothetical protein B0H13DRAFT_1850736 [Mycena leptocephala]|nr:hypothetical protein B0H13DRAFT_1850736 [Mycena leptocephala]